MNQNSGQLTLFTPAVVYISYRKCEEGEIYTTVFGTPEAAFAHASREWEELYTDMQEHYESDEIANWLADGEIHIDPRYLKKEVPFCNYFTEIAYDQVWVDVEKVYE